MDGFLARRRNAKFSVSAGREAKKTARKWKR